MGRYFGGCRYTYASGKMEVTGAMKDKHRELLREAEYYRVGLEKIEGLEEGGLYEVVRTESKFLVRVDKLRRDTVLCRVYAVEGEEAKKDIVRDDLSLSWGWEWTYKAVTVEEFPLYMSWAVRTRWFDKIFTSKKRG